MLTPLEVKITIIPPQGQAHSHDFSYLEDATDYLMGLAPISIHERFEEEDYEVEEEPVDEHPINRPYRHPEDLSTQNKVALFIKRVFRLK